MEEIKALTIEDDDVDFDILRRHLRRTVSYSIEISRVSYVSKGLELVQEKDFDVIFLDLHLPDAMGFDVVLKLTHLLNDIPVIIMSGMFSQDIHRKSMLLGCQEYLDKGTIDATSLDRILVAAVSRKKHEQEAIKNAIGRSSYFSSVIHELRTPLNGVIGFSEMLLEEDELNHDAVGNILKSGEHMLSLINDLLDISKAESGNLTIARQPTTILNMIEDCCRVVAAERGKKEIDDCFEISYDLALPERGFIDPFRNRQVLLNLLANACKFDPDGKIIVNASLEGSFLLLKIADNGPGLDKEAAEKVFEPFFQAVNSNSSSVPHGTGLGLSVCKMLIELMGGKIGVKSQLGRGAVFWYQVPLIDENFDKNSGAY